MKNVLSVNISVCCGEHLEKKRINLRCNDIK